MYHTLCEPISCCSNTLIGLAFYLCEFTASLDLCNKQPYTAITLQLTHISHSTYYVILATHCQAEAFRADLVKAQAELSSLYRDKSKVSGCMQQQQRDYTRQICSSIVTVEPGAARKLQLPLSKCCGVILLWMLDT